MDTRADRLRRARIAAGFTSASEAAARFGWSVNTYKANENGNAPFSFKKAKEYARAFSVTPEWLYDGAADKAAQEILVPLIGIIDANGDGQVTLNPPDWPLPRLVPAPLGASEQACALIVRNRGFLGMPFPENASVVYFEDLHTPPKGDMIGQIVVVETAADEVYVAKLHFGSEPGRYTLELPTGRVKHDVRLRWAANIIAILSPRLLPVAGTPPAP